MNNYYLVFSVNKCLMCMFRDCIVLDDRVFYHLPIIRLPNLLCVCNTLTSAIFRHFCATHKQGPCRTIYNNVSLFKSTENPWRLVQNREIRSDLSLCSNRQLGAYVSAV